MLYIIKVEGYRKDCIETLEETNTGNPEVLANFILWGMENYPANRYLLILWNHGGGWWQDPRRSIAYDDTSGGDALENQELKGVLSMISQKIGKGIDILGMDACPVEFPGGNPIQQGLPDEHGGGGPSAQGLCPDNGRLRGRGAL